ncbi:unnamed protein product [Polarella glacialis]|uniref:Uncharacterized protein n=1 Tax=Polarella glacialis TaxID=89957 RepID=A0A813GCD3_POLGL|nr:unnamed protein product [Polarella glacialis]
MPPKGSRRAAVPDGGRKRQSSYSTKIPEKKPKGMPSDSIVVALEQNHVDDMQSVTNKRGVRSQDDATQKILNDHFKTWSAAHVDMTMRAGQSLRQRLTEDRKKWMQDPTFAMGKYYDMALREEYGDATPETMIKIVDQDEPEDESLTKCLRKLFVHNRDLEPLSEYTQVCETINQKNVAAMFRAIMRVSPLCSIDNAALILDVLRMVSRLGLHTRFPGMFAVTKPHFDRACVKSLLRFKANGQLGKTWWDAHQDVAHLIVPADEVQAAFACKTAFVDIKDILIKIVGSSELGEKMFGRPLAICRDSDVAAIIQQSVAALGLAAITKVAVDLARVKFIGECKDLGKEPSVNFEKPKSMVVQYRGVATPVQARSFLQEWAIHVEALVRTVAVDLGQLPKLWREDDLVEKPRPQWAITIEASLIKDVSLARTTVIELLASDVATGETIRRLLKAKQALTKQIDRRFKIEDSFFENVVGEFAEVRLQRATLACLPDHSCQRAFSIEECLQKLNNMADSKLVQYCGSGPAATVTGVRTFVLAIRSGRAPAFPERSDTDFLVKVKTALGELCVFQKPASSDGAQVSLIAGPAVKAHYMFVVEFKGSITCAHLKPMQQFAWMLLPDERAQTDKWYKELMGGRCSRRRCSNSHKFLLQVFCCQKGKEDRQCPRFGQGIVQVDVAANAFPSKVIYMSCF